MTVQNKIDDGKELTLKEIAKRSRLALRTRTSRVRTVKSIDPPMIVGQIVDYLIPRTVLEPGPMIVRFQTNKITDPQDGDEYELYQQGINAPIANGNLGPVAGRPPEVDISVVTTALVDDDLTKGSTTYKYQLVVYKGTDGNPDYSPWFTAEIDRYAPEQDKSTGTKFKPEAAVFTNLPARGTIDDQWLEDNSSLDLTVNIGYEFYRPDDTVTIYADTNYGSGVAIHTQELTTNTVSIPKDKLPELDGLYYLWYVLRDVVGRDSDPALASSFNVARRPPPGLIDCEIPKGISPDVIDLEDLTSPVYVEVPYTTNGQETDRIIQSISNGTMTVPLGSELLGTPPRTLQFQVSTSRLVALWGASTAELPITAQYNFSRGVEPLKPSAVTNSALDFTYRGPVNPVFPELENPNMTKVQVVGDSGTVNHITANDRGKPVTISTPMVEASNTWVPLGDETAKLWYNGKEVYSLALTAGTVETLTFVMPATEIDNAGVGKKIAYWTIEETGGRNVMKSFDTEVQVDAARVDLPAPAVQLFNGFVSCRYLTRPDFELPVTVTIDPIHMPIDTVVTLKSVGTSDAAGLNPIVGTEFSDTYMINGTEVGGIFVRNIQPYLTKLKPIQPPHSSGLPNGYIKIWYEVNIEGAPNPSLEFLNEVSLLNASFNYCEGTPTN